MNDCTRSLLWAAALGTVLFAPALAPRAVMAQPSASPPAEGGAAVPAPPEPVPEPPETEVDLEAVLRGDGRGMTADAVAERAVRTAPSVERAEAAVQQAQAGADRALIGFVPQLSVSFRYTRLSEIDNPNLFGGPSIDPDMVPALVAGVDDPDARFLWQTTLTSQAELASFEFPILLNNYQFRASVQYPVSDVFLSVWPAFEGAQASTEAARLRREAQEREVALQAREAFYNYARARGAVAVARISVEQAEARHAQVEAFVTAGTAAPVDELRMRAQLAAARVAVARAEGGVQVAGTALRTLLHLEGGTRIAVGEDVLAPLPELDAEPEALVGRAMRQRRDVRAVRRLIEATGHQIDAAEGSRYPHVAVAANFDVANPNPRVFPQTDEFRESWDVSAVLTWSPHDLLEGEAQASDARARRAQARADLRSLEDGIRLQVIDAATSYRSARQALEAARLGVDAAEEGYRVQMERYRAGASTANDLIDASAEQLRAQLDLVNSAIDARVAWARLRRAIGREAR
ncbi:MAG TPA: TolC family protein [Sandaracinaceae bacterium LLY-WYZ-13_1]|nr:TolC family protein [Sandaracinaceae bacterium LLY-WYZ-13_1]